ncbi:MAG: hypothetical protein LBB12_03115 [Holosporaceae bacterium]|jgi:hypothetical protein|nr:hypothetical protein [Holosporaceae bacterium]
MKKIFVGLVCSLVSGCAGSGGHHKTPGLQKNTETTPKVEKTTVVEVSPVTSQIVVSETNIARNEKNVTLPASCYYEEDTPISSDNFTSIYDTVALKLAGLGNDVDAEYADFIRTKWKKLNENSLGLMRSWSQKYILPLIGEYQTVFYPFGGPDVSCPFKFFPDAHTYILVGLEPIGNFRNISENIKNPEIHGAMKRAFSWFLQKGFFVTSEMCKTLSSKFLNGTLYLILPQLARMGFNISNIEDLSIASDGKEVARTKGAIDCVKITCQKSTDETPRLVYYVRVNLAEQNPRLDNLINFMKNRSFVTFLKSASYALYCRTLVKFKKFLLANSRAVLQDDTGIPFDSFDKNWQKYAFGIYKGPLTKIFKDYKQQSMIDFYQNSDTIEIPFKMGYGFYQARPSLLLTVRKTAQANQSAVDSVEKVIVGNKPDAANRLLVPTPSAIDFLDKNSIRNKLLQQKISATSANTTMPTVDEEALHQYMSKMLTITEKGY